MNGQEVFKFAVRAVPTVSDARQRRALRRLRAFERGTPWGGSTGRNHTASLPWEYA